MQMNQKGSTYRGKFGQFGGCYAAESQVGFLDELNEVFHMAIMDKGFWSDFWELFPSHSVPFQYAAGLTRQAGGAKIWLKREDLCHSGSQNEYNIVGQVLLARRMKRTEIITECGSAKHGIACAAFCASLQMGCTIFIGAHDATSQYKAVQKMTHFGALVNVVGNSSESLRAAISEAFRTATTQFDTAYYIPSCPIGPHPYPLIFRTFQSFIGEEVLSQVEESCSKLPSAIVASVGGNGAGLGLFYPFIRYPSIALVGVESAKAAAITHGSLGVFHGMCTNILQDGNGQIRLSNSASPDLNYPGVGPELANWASQGWMECVAVDEEAAPRGVERLRQQEGIAAGLDTGFAVEEAVLRAGKLNEEEIVVLLVTGQNFVDPSVLRREDRK
ncbi:tryptophan synthase beta chain [Aspergillus ambiguus]|uniref:tryptophan synthase n=1 Tax=Aspergillus ambiguus TaxID=176160 RepID=UPI003CCDAA8B